jgi:hypothetical protein
MISPYQRCRDCRFWVSSQDVNCPNCGISRPSERFEDKSYLVKVALAPSLHTVFLFFIYLAMLLVALVITQSFGAIDEFLSAALVASAILIPLLLIGAGLGLARLAVRLLAGRTTRSERSLRKSWDTINLRLNEIEKRQEQIRSVQRRTAENRNPEWERVHQTLQDAARMLNLHHTRYKAKAIEVEAVRWQNSLNPLFYGWESLTYERTERRLRALDEASSKGVRLQGRLMEDCKSLADTSDFRELSIRLEETMVSCKRVHDGLVGRQAVLALKGLSPLEETAMAIPSPTAERKATEVFNTEVALTDFSTSFEELEGEYARLQSEGQVAQEINRLLTEAEY